MFGESKFDVLEKIPAKYKPVSIHVKYPTSTDCVHQIIKDNGLSLPIIFKPDLGERGWMVKKIKSETEIESYLQKAKWDFIIQEYIDLPFEFSVFYSRHPNAANGKVTSVTMKEMLKVKGDGRSTLQQLILSKDRAKLQWPVLQKTFAQQLANIPDDGKEIELVPIGNHCLGTTFLNRNNLINDKLSASFDDLSKQIDGFYFGRFDLRVASLQDLEDGKIMIMELNGCGAEPSHIYHPGASFFKAVRDLLIHWQTIYRISVANHRQGTPYLAWRKGVEIYKRFKAVTTSA